MLDWKESIENSVHCWSYNKGVVDVKITQINGDKNLYFYESIFFGFAAQRAGTLDEIKDRVESLLILNSKACVESFSEILSKPKNYISLYDDKYGVTNDNGTLTAYRHGEKWPAKSEDLIGDGFVLALVQKIEDLQEKIDNL